MSTRCPFAVWRPIVANHTVGGRRTIRGFVPHVQVGYGSLYGFFNAPKPPGKGASADFWCSRQGELEQYVDLSDQSWAQGSHAHNGNPYMVSCEFEGMPDEPMTAAQITKGGELIRWVLAEVNDFPLVVNTDPEGSGVTPHHVFGGGHTCPGPGPREGQFPDLIAAVHPVPAPIVEDDMTPGSCKTSDGVYHTFAVRASDGAIFETTSADGKVWNQPAQVMNGVSPALGVGGVDAEADGVRIDLTVIGVDKARTQFRGIREQPGDSWAWFPIPGSYA